MPELPTLSRTPGASLKDFLKRMPIWFRSPCIFIHHIYARLFLQDISSYWQVPSQKRPAMASAAAARLDVCSSGGTDEWSRGLLFHLLPGITVL